MVAKNLKNPNPLTRFISITFDDGLLGGALRSADLLDEFRMKGTYYIVTGWVKPTRIKPRDSWNANLDHGDWNDWRKIAARGHEIGSHTRSHLNASGWRARFLAPLLYQEIRNSRRDLREHLKQEPVSLSMPWNAATLTSELFARRFYRAVRLGSSIIQYNDLSEIQWYRLRSWAPNSEISLAELKDKIHATPPHHWLILQFHSLDGEGWMPLDSGKLRKIMECIAGSDQLSTVTIREMVARYKNRQIGTPD